MLWIHLTCCVRACVCVRVCDQQDPQAPSPYTALILHRLPLDCGLETPNLGFNCTTTQGQVRTRTHTGPHTSRATPYLCLICAAVCLFRIFYFSPSLNLLSLQLTVSRLFKNLDLQLLQPMSLTLMYSSPPLANESTITLDPMEITTFKLKLH